MDIIQAVVLGLVQGLGEFLPISSSAHLVLVPWLMKWVDPGLTFDIALHVGTLIAVVLYFWKDWLKLLSKGITQPKEREGKLFWYLVLATIPGAAIGFLLENIAETIFRNPVLIACMLILLGIILFFVDRKGTKQIDVEHITLRTSFLIGLSQALAIIPGVSRSGITMTTALALGMTREGAARFSFLLSAPIILGAALVKVPTLIANPAIIDASFLTGMVVACIAGLASIGFLLRYIQTKTFLPFVIYRFALGAVVIAVAVIRYAA
ncbi:MAG: UDP-diphosphatase [Deltaproteobacteria bacterium HGW-Deltaproteobacteria-6]|nr:MAG: UDP-diphosphatase [Deltaproteobacteria bacterium HGW-Deltaproteobacteria-6]